MADEYKAPLPRPTPEAQPFWDALRRHELQIQRCKACNTAFFYPRNVCPECLSNELEWFRASGRAKLHTYTIVYRPLKNPPLEAPYVLAMVELEEGPRMMSNVVEVEPSPKRLRCEMPLEIVFADVTPEITLPRFKPVG